METYRYKLQEYKGINTRYTCPSCKNKREFTRYEDSITGELLPEHVGRCNRINECGYHYSPKQYFEDRKALTIEENKTFVEKPTGYIPVDYFLKSYQDCSNNFIKYLYSIFNSQMVSMLHYEYGIGTSKYWSGATVFWQLDYYERVRTGKIMLFDDRGKRIKEPYNHIQWVHSILVKQKIFKDFNLKQCFFGEHLLRKHPERQVAIVEGESTAIIAAGFMPEYTWLATGGSNGCRWYDPNIFKILRGRTIKLFPDLGYYNKWLRRGQELEKQGFNISVSDLLERNAPSEHKAKGNFDLRDYLVR